MKYFDKNYNEPENYLDEMDRKTKSDFKWMHVIIWFILIVAIISLCGCDAIKQFRATNKTEWLERNDFLKDSSTTETKFIQGETKIIKDTTYISSSDTLRTDSTITITNNYYHEKYFYQKDTLIFNNNKVVHVKAEPIKPSWWYNFWQHIGVMSFAIMILAAIGGYLRSIIIKR